MKVKWIGIIPKNCDICRGKITAEFIDGRTVHGPWAVMCPKCFKDVGVGLGIGKGQRYSRKGVKLE